MTRTLSFVEFMLAAVYNTLLAASRRRDADPDSTRSTDSRVIRAVHGLTTFVSKSITKGAAEQRLSKAARTVRGKLLHLGDPIDCLGVMAVASPEVVAVLADEFGVSKDGTTYEIAMRLVAQRWPGSSVAMNVTDQERAKALMMQSFGLA